MNINKNNGINAFSKHGNKRKLDSSTPVLNKTNKITPEKEMNNIAEQRKLLPISFGKQALVNEILRNDTVLVMSETGSGKTTQLPQYLLETKLARKGVICCTQPRRIAAITVAERVAKERGSSVGELVGYTIRFEDASTPQTRLKYMTDGMLLREALLDPLLMKYSVVILDEAHERSVQTDILFGIVKSAQAKRLKPLKIVVMSATLNISEFEKYFNNAKVCYIEGRRHPIKILYSEEVQKDYPHASIVSAFQLHRELPMGEDILVFLTGQEEIEAAAKFLRDIYQHMHQSTPKLLVCILFASLPKNEQMSVFSKAPEGTRKIIFATNIAETSVTIPGIKYVIDCGMVKAKVYNPLTGLDMLKVQPISKAQARQRSGRAGRECAGVCYRLYQESAFSNLQENTVPEIQRCNVRSICLQLLTLGVKDLQKFDFISPPADGAIEGALKQLVLLGAVSSIEEQTITPKGKTMAAFPLDPCLAACIMAAHEFGCVEEVIIIVSLLSVDSLTYSAANQREKSRKVFAKFHSPEGDHISLLLFYRAYKAAKGNFSWCKEHFLNTVNMKTVLQIRQQLKELCVRHNIPIKNCGNNFSLVRKSMAHGLFLNSAELQRDGVYMTMIQKQEVRIHPSSVLFNLKPAFVVFNEVMETSKRYMRHISVVDPEWLVDASPSLFDRNKLTHNSVLS